MPAGQTAGAAVVEATLGAAPGHAYLVAETVVPEAIEDVDASATPTE